QGGVGHALRLRDRFREGKRWRRIRGIHAGALDVWRAERVPVALEGRRHRYCPVDDPLLPKHAGQAPRIVEAHAKSGGDWRGEEVASWVDDRGGGCGRIEVTASLERRRTQVEGHARLSPSL